MKELHTFDNQLISELFESRISRVSKLMDKSKTDGRKLARLILVVQETMGYAFALQKSPQICQHYLHLLKDAMIGNFALADSDHPVEIQLLDNVFLLEAIEPKQRLGHDNWRKALFLAIICRDDKGVDILSSISDVLLDSAVGQEDSYHNIYTSFLKASLQSKPEKDQLMLQTYKSFGRSEIIVADHDYVDLIEAPQLDLLASLFANNVTEFSERWKEALIKHQQYWSQKRGLNRGDSPLYNDATGFFSIPLTAIGSLAFDKGFEMNYDSAYTPKYLVEKSKG